MRSTGYPAYQPSTPQKPEKEKHRESVEGSLPSEVSLLYLLLTGLNTEPAERREIVQHHKQGNEEWVWEMRGNRWITVMNKNKYQESGEKTQ